MSSIDIRLKASPKSNGQYVQKARLGHANCKLVALRDITDDVSLHPDYKKNFVQLEYLILRALKLFPDTIYIDVNKLYSITKKSIIKKGVKQSTILPAIEELKNNSIGNKENEKVRIKAMSVLENAKEQESIKKEKGHKYMSKGKTSVFVAPNRFEHYLGEGFKFN